MILGITIFYIMGILGGLYKKIFVIVPFIILLFFNSKIKRYIKYTIKSLIIYIIIFIIGIVYIITLENGFESKYKDAEEELSLVGTIVSNPKYKEYNTQYIIKVSSKQYKNTYLLLNIKNGSDTKLKYGNQIYIKGEFKLPEVARNYKGFSYKQYLKTKKIYGTINTTQNNIKIIKENNINVVMNLANVVANKINEKIDKLFSTKQAGLLKGILIGNKNDLDSDIVTNFKNSNLSHMLAISGAHVSYIILGVTIFFSKTKINKKVSKVTTILILVFFMMLVGGGASVTRACIMAIYTIFSGIIHKKPNILSSISISLLAILINNPYEIFNIGMLLSYGGTIGIIIFAKKFMSIESIIHKTPINKFILQMVIVSISANIIILPIMAYNFNTISLTFIISNVLASPILGIVIILGFLCVILSFIFAPFAYILSFLLKIFLELLIQIAEFSSKLPFSKIYVKTPSVILIVIYYSVIYLFLRLKSKNKKYRFEKKIIAKLRKINYKKVIAIGTLTIIIFLFIRIFPKDLKIYFIDVGQGDSSLIVTPYGKTILIDGGGSSKEETFNVGEQILFPYLLDRGITKLDYCIISHFDLDHVGRNFIFIKRI